jgi:ribose 5-phosphate isomerase A
MAEPADPVLAAKRAAARAALDLVVDGMTLGLGSGSTAELFIAALGECIAGGSLGVRGVPTSGASARAAQAAGVPLIAIDDVTSLDLDVDGADEVDPALNMIKGGGGCLLREKIVARASKRMVVIVDRAKLVPALGRFPLPVEVDRFGWRLTAGHVAGALMDIGTCEPKLGATNPRIEVKLRHGRDGAPFVTDGGHYILDCATGPLVAAPRDVAAALAQVPGVVEHGLFIGLASVVIVGEADGRAEVITSSALARSA